MLQWNLNENKKSFKKCQSFCSGLIVLTHLIIKQGMAISQFIPSSQHIWLEFIWEQHKALLYDSWHATNKIKVNL